MTMCGDDLDILVKARDAMFAEYRRLENTVAGIERAIEIVEGPDAIDCLNCDGRGLVAWKSRDGQHGIMDCRKCGGFGWVARAVGETVPGKEG